MTIHVLVACSKSKKYPPSNGLVWNEEMNLESWNKAWSTTKADKFVPMELYSGRATRRQLEISLTHPDSKTYLISAGGGLFRIDSGLKIPSYEATFGANRGPTFGEWHLLSEGGLENISIQSEEDRVLVFAPPAYLKAISKDPMIDKITNHLVTSLSSPLGKRALFPVRVHPRSKEVLGVGAADLNTELIRLYLDDGIPAIERVSDQAEDLPPKPERRKVSDEELFKIVSEHHQGRTNLSLVRFIRDDLGISASVERITKARKSAL